MSSLHFKLYILAFSRSVHGMSIIPNDNFGTPPKYIMGFFHRCFDNMICYKDRSFEKKVKKCYYPFALKLLTLRDGEHFFFLFIIFYLMRSRDKSSKVKVIFR